MLLRLEREGKTSRNPFKESFGNPVNLRYVMRALFGATAGACRFSWVSSRSYERLLRAKRSRMRESFGFSSPGVALAVLCASACGPLGSEGEGLGAPSAGSGSNVGGSGGTSDGAGGGSPGGSSGGEAPSGGVARWNGIVGTGQSLAVGTTPLNPAVNQTDHGNLKLTVPVTLQPPFDPLDASLSMVRLEEPLRGQGSGFPRAYPGNLWGETPHGAMANQISVLVQQSLLQPHVTVHSAVGESGQGMVALRKGAIEMMMDGGIVGRAYAASMFEAAAITRLAAAEETTYGVSAIVMTHGDYARRPVCSSISAMTSMPWRAAPGRTRGSRAITARACFRRQHRTRALTI